MRKGPLCLAVLVSFTVVMTGNSLESFCKKSVWYQFTLKVCRSRGKFCKNIIHLSTEVLHARLSVFHINYGSASRHIKEFSSSSGEILN